MIKRMLISLFGLALLTGTAFAGSMTITDSDLDGVSAQGLQIIENDNRTFEPIADQDNNLDSVQLNNEAQQNAHVAAIVNSAKSAVNTSANILIDAVDGDGNGEPPPSGKSFSNSFSQSNENDAVNHKNKAMVISSGSEDSEDEGTLLAIAANVNKQKQTITNTPTSVIEDQENNNNSVQLNDYAQQNAVGTGIVNASTSALNFGLNIFVANNVSGTNGSSSNTQSATNMSNEAMIIGRSDATAIAVAGNAELGITQTVANGIEGQISNQDNNNNSVQVNDNAQENAMVLAIMNSAQSAANAAENLAQMLDVSGSNISQSTENKAVNHTNIAIALTEEGIAVAGNLNKQTQNVSNMDGTPVHSLGIIDEQDNNNNSVQVNDDAQRTVQAVLLENAASSAVNAAVNIIHAGNVSGSTLDQSNVQIALNYDNLAVGTAAAIAANAELNEHPGQWINNVHGTIYDQDNNNNSVQLNDNAQKDIVVDKTINSANSAVNVGQNIMSLGDVTASTISQSNWQYASNHNNAAISGDIAIAANINKQTQIIHNCFCSDLSQGTQDNNMNSVQLNDCAQQNAQGVIIVNAADSAVNGALNIINSGTVANSSMSQSNTNTAVNFSNIAVGGTIAVAGNTEGISLPVLVGPQ